jgi:hypothetical protein
MTDINGGPPAELRLTARQAPGSTPRPDDVTAARVGRARRRRLPAHLAPIRVDPRRPPRPLTRAEAARALRRHARTLDRWARLGLLRTIEISGTVRIPAEEAERLLRAGAPRSGA